MRPLSALREILSALFRKRTVERELDEEMRFHIERETERNVERGMTPEQARRAALRTFGGVERWKEHTRDARGAAPLEALARDLGFAARVLRKSPGFTAVAVLTLGIGIGSTTAIFSVVDGVLLDPLPYEEPDRLVSIWGRFLPESGFDFVSFPLSPPEYLDYRAETRALDDVAAWHDRGATLTGTEGEPQRIRMALVSGTFFRVLGVEAPLGRALTPEDDPPGGTALVVIGHGLWQTRFGGDPAVVGRTLTLDGEPREVVGVMPSGFAYPGEDTQLWAPLGLDPATQTNRSSHWLFGVGRLAAGGTLESADAEMETLMARWKADFPDIHTGHFLFLSPLVDDVVGSARPALLVLLGAVGFVLLIVCANVAGLMLARSEARQRELAVRSALGAGRRRLMRQLLVEGALLALLGGALGVALAYAGVGVVLALGAGSIPRAGEVAVDGRVLAFAGALSLVTALLFSLAPALRAARSDPRTALAERGPRGTVGLAPRRARQALVVAEVALALLLVTGAGLFVRTLGELLAVDPGFRPDGALVTQLSLPSGDYPGVRAAADFHRELGARLATLPGVTSASAAADLPFLDTPGNVDFDIEGRAPTAPGEPRRSGDLIFALPRWTEAMGVPVLEGRFFRPADDAEAPRVAVVNRTAAALFWPEASPIGARIRPAGMDGSWHTVVGVVDDVRFEALDAEPRQAWYVPASQAPWPASTMFWVLRTEGDPLALAPAVRRAVWDLDDRLPIIRTTTLEEVVAVSVARERFTMALLIAFAGIALLLGAVGIYGVMSYAVTQRTRELGIRMALGSGTGRTAGLVMRQALALVVAGLALGIPAALVGTRYARSLLYGVEPSDPATLAAAAAILAAAALLAAWLPARRATRVDPMGALRAE